FGASGSTWIGLSLGPMPPSRFDPWQPEQPELPYSWVPLVGSPGRPPEGAGDALSANTAVRVQPMTRRKPVTVSAAGRYHRLRRERPRIGDDHSRMHAGTPRPHETRAAGN